MTHFGVRKSVLSVCFFMAIYYLLMELYYYYFVGVEYLKFQMHLNINYEKYIETKILFLLTLVFSIFISKKSEFIYAIFIFFSIFFLIPGLVTYSFEDQIRGPLYSIVVLLIAIGLISSQKIKIPQIQSISISRGVIAVLILIALMPFVYSFGLNVNFNNLLLDDIYETRGIFDDNSSTSINYLYHWLVKAIIPVLFIYFLIRRRYLHSVFVFAIPFYLYLISGNKIVYFTLFIAL